MDGSAEGSAEASYTINDIISDYSSIRDRLKEKGKKLIDISKVSFLCFNSHFIEYRAFFSFSQFSKHIGYMVPRYTVLCFNLF